MGCMCACIAHEPSPQRMDVERAFLNRSLQYIIFSIKTSIDSYSNSILHFCLLLQVF